MIAESREESAQVVSVLFRDKSLMITSFTFDKLEGDDYLMTLKIEKLNHTNLEKIVSRLQATPGVKEITWDA